MTDKKRLFGASSLSDLSPAGVTTVIVGCALVVAALAWVFFDDTRKESIWIFYLPAWMTVWFALLGWFVKSTAELKWRGQLLLVGSVVIAAGGRAMYEPGLAAAQSNPEIQTALEHLAGGVMQLILIAGAAIGANFVSAAWLEQEAQRNRQHSDDEVVVALNRLADAAQKIAAAKERSALSVPSHEATAPLWIKVLDTVAAHYGRR